MSEPVAASDPERGPVSARGRASCAVWGVLNVTPDSFSDGGRYLGLDDALSRGRQMLAEGADVLDVGGESSRPAGRTYGAGAAAVPAAEERARVVPVVERLVAEGASVSVDTVKAAVAEAALSAGARVVNDVSCGASLELLDAVAAAEAEIVLMHTRDGGRVEPSTTDYGGDAAQLVSSVLAELERAARRAQQRGIPPSRVWLDPGIGFAKTARQSAALLGNLDAFVATGYRVLVGASRKSFIAKLTEGDPAPDRRLGGSLAAVCAAAFAGCAAVRVHDVFESVQAVRLTEAMRAGRRAGP